VKRILVALDSSPRAPMVLAAAVDLARPSGAKLVLYRAIGVSPDLPRDILKYTDTRLEDVLTDNANRELRQLAQELPPGLVEDALATFAIAWDGICTVAREKGADLIVIGSHGYGGLDRVLGTTAAKVVNRSEHNVLVVRKPL